jgi:hypothetical protein
MRYVIALLLVLAPQLTAAQDNNVFEDGNSLYEQMLKDDALHRGYVVGYIAGVTDALSSQAARGSPVCTGGRANTRQAYDIPRAGTFPLLPYLGMP